MKIHSLSTHPSADGKSGEVFVLHKNTFWSFTAQQCLWHSPKQLKKLGTCFIKLTKQSLIRHNPSLWKLQGAGWFKEAILTPFFSQAEIFSKQTKSTILAPYLSFSVFFLRFAHGGEQIMTECLCLDELLLYHELSVDSTKTGTSFFAGRMQCFVN